MAVNVKDFICEDAGVDKHRYQTPYANLQVTEYPSGGLTTLHLSGFPFVENMIKGKKYKITVEEVE